MVKKGIVTSGVGLLFLTFPQKVHAAEIVDTVQNALGGTSDAVKMYVLIGLLSVIPAFLILTTCFTRIIIVFSFLRSSLGTQQNPPNTVLIGLAAFLTFFIMRPAYTEVYHEAAVPLMEDQIGIEEFFYIAEDPIRDFMLKQTREKDLTLFLDLQGDDMPTNTGDVSLLSLIPAFAISELRTAFTIGFLIFIPFLVIDVVVASILMSMGMFMLSPVMISLPFKLLLFVLVDGWYLVVESLVLGFQ